MLHDIILEIIVLGKHLIHNAKVVSFFSVFNFCTKNVIHLMLTFLLTCVPQTNKVLCIRI